MSEKRRQELPQDWRGRLREASRVLYRNATLLTMDRAQPLATCLRLAGGRIAGVGHLTPEPGEEVVDLEGAFVLPGLWDTHIHLLFYAQSLAKLDCSDCRSREELLARLEARAGQTPAGEWVEAGGWGEGSWDDPRLPTLDALDRASQGRPTLLSRADLHSVLVNRAALERAGIDRDTPSPAGGLIERGADGELTGRVLDLAISMVSRVVPTPTVEQQEAALLEATRRLHRWGIVGVCDQRIKDQSDGSLALALYRKLRLPLRIHCNLAAHQLGPGLEPFGSGDDWIRIGHVKFFADGSLGSRSARMREPYLQAGTAEGGRGLWLTPPHELLAGFREARRWGFPISVHAIGDEAIGAVLDAFEAIGPGPLDRIEHLQILDPADLERVARSGITASMQPVHLLDDRAISTRWLGERSQGYYRLASLERAGVRLAFGSDAPVATADPWLGLRAAVERRGADSESAWFPEECLSAESALRAYTVDGAQSLGWDGFGRLSTGAPADLVVLDRDPQAGCPKVLQTIVNGSVVYVGN